MKALVRIFLSFICIFTLTWALSGCEFLNPDGGAAEECAHVFGDWTVVNGDFCEERLHSRTCTLCGEIDYREGSEADHYWGEVTTHEPTCINEGYDEKTCRICGKVDRQNVLPATGLHSNILIGTDEPNCIRAGINYYECESCGIKTEESFGEPTGEHDLTRLVAFESCHVYYCWYCDTQELAEDHVFPNGSSICNICGYDSAKVYDIEIWVSEAYGVSGLFIEQIERFAIEKGCRINLSIHAVTEADAGMQIFYNPSIAPDLFCFDQSYTKLLYNVSALTRLSDSDADMIRLGNDKASVLSATVGDGVYAYPMTSDNGYYMYYDPSVITNPDSLEQIIADCEAAGKKIRFASNNSWYVASFFFGTGCKSEWIVDNNGSFIGVNDSFNSDAGLAAMKALTMLTSSPAFSSDNDTCDGNTAVWITGLWNDSDAIDLGFSATDLPSFTVDGVSYHMGSFSGTKLMGVKPTEDADKAKLLEELALYLTGYECQMERLGELRWCPSNLEAQANDQRIGCSALFEQNKYATPQGYIHGAWWDIAATLGREAKLGATEAELIAALGNYENSINELFNNTNDTEWSIIGEISDAMWDVDFPLTEISEGVYMSDVIRMNEGDEFVVRKDLSWEMYFGPHGLYGGNFKIEATGDYVIRITVISEYEISVQIILYQ